ncbi:MAG TPA: tetratricopeptide repeat protein, partial [Puia sp.]|nr:tetratricopeptide repeat protein [Puia sp.]
MLHKAIPDREHLARAKALETEGEVEEAMEVYQRVLKNDPLNETAVGRLLVLYRRQKAYKEELA